MNVLYLKILPYQGDISINNLYLKILPYRGNMGIGIFCFLTLNPKP